MAKNVAVLAEICNLHSGSRAPIELAKFLSNQKGIIKIYFFCFDKNIDKEAVDKLKKASVEIIFLKTVNLSFFEKLKASFSLFNYFKTFKIDLILFSGSLPMFLAAKLLRKPIFTTYYGTQFDAYFEKFIPTYSQTLLDKFLNVFFNLLIYISDLIVVKFSDKVIAISKFTAKECSKLFGKKIQFIYSGVDLKIDKGLAHKKSSPLRILSISRITPYKNFHLLIQAINTINLEPRYNIELTIVGSQPKRKYLNYLNKIKKTSTKILLDLDEKSLSKAYQSCDIYVSADRYLFFGFPPIEASIFKKPSILFNYCAAKEIVENNKTGFIVENTDELIDKLKFLTLNRQKILKMGRVAYFRNVKKFSLNNTAYLYSSLINFD